MNLALVRAGAILLVATLLQACGGGGGDSNGGGGNSNVRLSVSTKQVSVAAEPGDQQPVGSVVLTVTNPPKDGLFVGTILSGSGVESFDLSATSETQATLSDHLPVSRHTPERHLHRLDRSTCLRRRPCAKEISGSPVTIETTYEVSGGVVGSLERNSVELTTDGRDDAGQQEFVQLTLDHAPANGIYVQTEYTSNAISYAYTSTASATTADVSISFKSGLNVGAGTFTDTVTVTVCYDASCVRQVGGSPFVISTRMVVSVGAEPGYTELEVASRTTLAHNVVDAEFSKALNAVVMVGNYPANALYVYDVATGTEHQQALVKVPTAVSVSPDGLTAAVGHDALISVVDLAAVGQPGAPVPTTLNVAIDVLDIVLDGRGRVHALPRFDQWQQIHTVDIATNTEMLSEGSSLYAGTLGRLHPSGDYLYTADNGLSPSDIAKWDVRGDHAVGMYDSPYHGDYDMCGNLWFHENGASIYTACGNSFRSSEVQAQDMIYAGALEMTPTEFYGWLIVSLSQSAATNEIALIEEGERYYCRIIPGSGPCYTHLTLFESDFLNRLAIYTIGPVTVNDTAYAQRGMFIFHNADGTQKYMISRLEGMPNPDAEYYLSVID